MTTAQTRNNYLLKRFGITNEQYQFLLGQQEESCAVCKRHYSVFKVRLCVDHDHHTGFIRGLLCNYCNRRIIGRHRTPEGERLLKSASEYLQRQPIGWI